MAENLGKRRVWTQAEYQGVLAEWRRRKRRFFVVLVVTVFTLLVGATVADRFRPTDGLPDTNPLPPLILAAATALVVWEGQKLRCPACNEIPATSRDPWPKVCHRCTAPLEVEQ